jgi:hypothetical protein
MSLVFVFHVLFFGYSKLATIINLLSSCQKFVVLVFSPHLLCLGVLPSRREVTVVDKSNYCLVLGVSAKGNHECMLCALRNPVGLGSRKHPITANWMPPGFSNLLSGHFSFPLSFSSSFISVRRTLAVSRR